MITSETMKTYAHSTPMGTMHSTWTDKGLYRLVWAGQEDQDGVPSKKLDSAAKQLDRALKSYFSQAEKVDDDVTFSDIPVDASGWTEFHRLVYQECRKIAAGTTISYKQLAEMAGRAKASRAVGAAMSKNRVLLVIPCHRVVSSSGKLTGFSAPGGLMTKQQLLDLEQSQAKLF